VRGRRESTPALHGGRMYPLGDNGAIYDAATGASVGEANFHGYVAFADGVAYVPWLGGILAVDGASWMLHWTVAGDGGDVGEAPLVATGHLYVGSEDAYVAALRRSDGAVRWCAGTAGIPVLRGHGKRRSARRGTGGGGRLPRRPRRPFPGRVRRRRCRAGAVYRHVGVRRR
jgi:hypothetical protein